MRKQEIIEYLTHSCGLHRASAIRAVNGMFDLMASTLCKGEDIMIRDFGVFRVVDVPARTSFNIAEKAMMPVPPHKAVRFSPSQVQAEKCRQTITEQGGDSNRNGSNGSDDVRRAVPQEANSLTNKDLIDHVIKGVDNQ